MTEAAAHAPLTVLNSLLEHQAIVKGTNALLAAATSPDYDREERIELLLKYGAELDGLVPRCLWHINFDRRLPVPCETALHAACRWGFADSALHLLFLGADSRILDSDGRRPLQLRKQTVSDFLYYKNCGLLSSDQRRLNLRWYPRTFVSFRAKARFAAERRERAEIRSFKRQYEGRNEHI